MSLLADFDFVAEISREALLGLVRRHVSIGGEPLNPPFELQIPITGDGITGTAHLIVTALELALNADDSMTLTLPFEHASVTLTAPIERSRAGIKGALSIRAPLLLDVPRPEDRWTQRLAVDLAAATVGLDVPAISEAEADVLRRGAQRHVRTLGRQSFPPDLSLVPRALHDDVPFGNGSIDPSLRFVRLEVHRVTPDAIGLFGILLAANDAKGDHRRKTTTAIPSGRDISVSVSPQALQTLFFCPGVAGALADGDVSRLPGSCGASARLALGGADLTALTMSFAAGHIALDATAVMEKERCYRATGEVRAELSFSVVAGVLTPSVRVHEPRVHLRLRGFCRVASAAALGPLVLPLNALADRLASDFAAALVPQGLGARLPVIGLGDLYETRMAAVRITPEGLTLDGNLPAAPSSGRTRGFRLGGDTVDVRTTVVGSGKTRLRGCTSHEFPYTDVLVWQETTSLAMPTLLARPLRLEWFVGDSTTALSGASGTITPTLTRHYPPNGAPVRGQVRIEYTISGDHLVLRNVPEDGVYTITVRARATEPDGTTFEDVDFLTFEGHRRNIEDGYIAALVRCGLPADLTVRWRSPISDLRPDARMRDLIATVVGSGGPHATEILSGVRMVYGSAFQRAVFGPRTLTAPQVRPGGGALR